MRKDDFRNQTNPRDDLGIKGDSKKLGNRLARRRLRRLTEQQIKQTDKER